jgi:hypothetical protein
MSCSKSRLRNAEEKLSVLKQPNAIHYTGQRTNFIVAPQTSTALQTKD